MKLSRTFNAKRNIISGVINKLLGTLFLFVIRTVIIYRLGVEYVGLNSLFTSILSTLSLAELGFSSAIVTIMYKSVANNDNEELSALLNFIRKAYYLVGTIILICGIICMPFLRVFIKDFDNIPDNINIYHIYIVFLLNTVASYFFGGYRNSVLGAYQRQDLISKINSIVNSIFYCIEIIAIFVSQNYYVYIYLIVITSIVVNIATNLSARKHFPDIVPKGRVRKEEIKTLKRILVGTFYAKVGGVLSQSFDNIIISSFLGIAILAYYSNYSYIITAIQGFLVILYKAIQAGIGNSASLDSVEKNYNDMLKFTFIYNWAVGWTSICLIYLFNPFIKLWIGETGILPTIVVLLIVLNYYVRLCGGIQGTYKSALGIWWQDRYRCIIGGLVNLGLNVIIVLTLQQYGDLVALGGVVLSTIISDLLILTPWEIKVTFDIYFKQGMSRYIKQMLFYFSVTVLNIVICFPVMQLISSIFGDGIVCLVLRGVVCVILPNLVYYFIYHKLSSQYKPAKEFVAGNILRKK